MVFVAPGYQRMPPLVGDLTILDGIELLALPSGFPRGVLWGEDRADPNSFLSLFPLVQGARRVLLLGNLESDITCAVEE